MWRWLRTLLMWGFLLMGCARKVPDVDLQNAASDLPAAEDAELDTWIARQEAHITDITPGTEKTILRVSDGKTPISFVYLHGFSATRQELSPMVELLSERFGANAYFARLRGHGRSEDAMLDGDVESWMKDTAEAMEIGRRLGEKVVVVGTSTGGTLAAWLAGESPPDLAAIVYVSPNFALRDKRSKMMLWPGRRLLIRLAIGSHREWTPSTDLIGRYWTNRYPSKALFPMIDLVNHVSQVDLSQVRQPAMVVYSAQDEVIDSAEVVSRFAEMGATPKRLLEVTDDTDSSHHVIAGELCSPETTIPVTDAVTDFLEEALGVTARRR